jgi:hypothetical protein
LRAPKAHSNAGKGISNRGKQAMLRCFDIPLDDDDSQLQLQPLSKAGSSASSTHKRATRARKRKFSWRRVMIIPLPALLCAFIKIHGDILVS